MEWFIEKNELIDLTVNTTYNGYALALTYGNTVVDNGAETEISPITTLAKQMQIILTNIEIIILMVLYMHIKLQMYQLIIEHGQYLIQDIMYYQIAYLEKHSYLIQLNKDFRLFVLIKKIHQELVMRRIQTLLCYRLLMSLLNSLNLIQ